MTDYQFVRGSIVCPLCGSYEKPLGNIACWPCYHENGMRYGHEIAETVIRAADDLLSRQSIPAKIVPLKPRHVG